MIANVSVDIAHSNIDRLFSYIVPEDMDVSAGHRVLVPFGAGNRKTEGFVIGLDYEAQSAQGSLKQIIRTLEPYTVLLPDQLELAKWMVKNYKCLLVEALRVMIPAQLRGGRVKEKRIRTVRLADGIDIDAVISKMYSKNGKLKSAVQYEIVDMLQKAGCEMSVKDICGFIPGAQSAISSLLRKGVLEEDGRTVYRQPYMDEVAVTQPLSMTPAQETALSEIISAIDSRHGSYLLHGVTGSGKTEVYMQAISHALSAGGTAIVLVPEISLTPQTVDRFRGRFGDRVAVLHSRLSPGERFDEWRRIRLGRVSVVGGARSALFAPLENIRLIVIDEEHEQSYYSETSPRYSAIDVASHRCSLNGAALVLGSATPALNDYFKAMRGRLTLLEMPDRISGIPMPRVEVVDMRKEFLKGNSSIFSTSLYNSLKGCLDRGEQAILFINRRGYSTFVSCRGCGHVFSCPDCDVSMTYHKPEACMKCHYCGRISRIPDKCPECGKPYIKYFGIGTQQVEEQFLKYFSVYTALRMDMDTTGARNAHQRILKAFENKEAQVLIGTQMVAKGLDIKNVTLVGVIAADAMLHIPDFRGWERTVQLLTQVAGRAGRHKKQGEVIIQTYSPDHPAVTFASKHDYKGFYDYEIAQRRASLFPPYSAFIRVLICTEEERLAEELSEQYANGIREIVENTLKSRGAKSSEVLLIMASPAPVKRRQGIYRYQVLMRFARTRNTPALVEAIYDYALSNRREEISFPEINPMDMF